MYISLRIRKRVMLCVIAVLSMLAAVAVMPTFGDIHHFSLCMLQDCKRRKNRWDKASDHNVSQHRKKRRSQR